jgi:hypothetical protein
MDCFICLEKKEEYLYKSCNCNTFVHKKCLEKMVQTVSSHNTHCAVCRTKYDIKSKIIGIGFLSFDAITRAYIAFHICSIFLFATSMLMLQYSYPTYLIGIAILHFLTIFLCVIHYWHYRLTNTWCYLKLIRRRIPICRRTMSIRDTSTIYYV